MKSASLNEIRFPVYPLLDTSCIEIEQALSDPVLSVHEQCQAMVKFILEQGEERDDYSVLAHTNFLFANAAEKLSGGRNPYSNEIFHDITEAVHLSTQLYFLKSALEVDPTLGGDAGCSIGSISAHPDMKPLGWFVISDKNAHIVSMASFVFNPDTAYGEYAKTACYEKYDWVIPKDIKPTNLDISLGYCGKAENVVLANLERIIPAFMYESVDFSRNSGFPFSLSLGGNTLNRWSVTSTEEESSVALIRDGGRSDMPWVITEGYFEGGISIKNVSSTLFPNKAKLMFDQCQFKRGTFGVQTESDLRFTGCLFYRADFQVQQSTMYRSRSLLFENCSGLTTDFKYTGCFTFQGVRPKSKNKTFPDTLMVKDCKFNGSSGVTDAISISGIPKLVLTNSDMGCPLDLDNVEQVMASDSTFSSLRFTGENPCHFEGVNLNKYNVRVSNSAGANCHFNLSFVGPLASKYMNAGVPEGEIAECSPQTEVNLVSLLRGLDATRASDSGLPWKAAALKGVLRASVTEKNRAAIERVLQQVEVDEPMLATDTHSRPKASLKP